MRNYKFRGKRKDNGEWVYGLFCKHQFGNYGIYLPAIQILKEYDNRDFLSYFEVIPKTVGQYIGFTDKDGNEIYEGDIAEKESIEYIHHLNNICEKRKKVWRGVVIKVDAKYIYKGKKEYYLAGTTGFKVIGNIYDNLELLKGVKND